MSTCDSLCQLFANINWLWYIIAVIVVFGIGAIWYSALFSKAWTRVFKVEMPEKITTLTIVRTMALQFIANALFGLVFFILVKYSVWVALLALVGFCGWEKGSLNFQFPKMKNFLLAALIHVGYMFIAGIVFILFGLI